MPRSVNEPPDDDSNSDSNSEEDNIEMENNKRIASYIRDNLQVLQTADEELFRRLADEYLEKEFIPNQRRDFLVKIVFLQYYFHDFL
jgi:hypothetical protein